MTLLAKDVAQYLKDHPDFFNQYTEILTQISIPDPHGGRAVSITERQISTLRDQIKHLESRLAELLRFGEENDVLSGKTHRLAMSLMASTDVTGVLLVLYSHLDSSFDIPYVAVRLWGIPGDSASLEFQPLSATAKGFVIAQERPYCGAAGSDHDIEDWFGEDCTHVRSIAIVALRDGDHTFGMLALGSDQPERFHPEMGTLYLERIGELAAAALMRTCA